MTRLSRRQLSYGQNQLGKEKTKLQTASNQVIAAYGDPRDTKFLQSSNKKTDEVEKHDVELSDSENSDEMVSENQDTIRENTQDLIKNPFIPKLDLASIYQDPKKSLNSSLGQKNLIASAGGPNLNNNAGQQLQ
jgi:hypothetical protein